MEMPSLLPVLLSTTLLIACGPADESVESREYAFAGISGSKVVIRPASTDSTRDVSQNEFEAFLGDRIITLVSRILWVDGEYRIILDTAYLRIKGWPEAERTVPAAAVAGDSAVFDLIGRGFTIGMDTLVVHRRDDTLAIRYFGMKIFSAGQTSAHFGYTLLPEHRALLDIAHASPGLDSVVSYRINLDYLDIRTDPAGR